MTPSAFHNDDPHKQATTLRREIATAEEFNPWRALDFGNKGSETTIEASETARNVRWQMRTRVPTADEHKLAEALGQIFMAGTWELAGIVARLNELGLKTPQGTAWTAENFERAMTALEASL